MLRAAAKRGAAALRGAAPQSPSLPVGMPSRARGMAGGHGHGQGVEHGGLTLHPPKAWHTNVATGMSALMWFWVLLRWKEDGSTLIFGHAPHFQHELEEEEKALGVLYAAGKKGGKSGH